MKTGLIYDPSIIDCQVLKILIVTKDELPPTEDRGFLLKPINEYIKKTKYPSIFYVSSKNNMNVDSVFDFISEEFKS